VAVNKPLKIHHITCKRNGYYLRKAHTHQQETITPHKALPGQWIETAWNDKSTETSVKFKKYCVLNDINRKDDPLWEEVHEENSCSIYYRVGSNCLNQ
jgi:hypothetical protein